jgi:hypothetical protein
LKVRPEPELADIILEAVQAVQAVEIIVSNASKAKIGQLISPALDT